MAGPESKAACHDAPAGKAGHEHLILVIEDHTDTRDSLRMFLEIHKFNVVATSKAADALAKLRAGLEPCVIVLDLNLPEMSGFEFRRAQLADAHLAGLPVLVVSAAGKKSEDEARVLGLEAFFRKPMDIDAFLGAVQHHCGRSGIAPAD